MGGVAEVSKLHLTLLVNEDVVTLDISVNNVTIVKVLETKQGLPQHVLASIFGVVGAHFCNNSSESIVHDFDKNPEASLILILVIYFEHEVILCAHVHQGYLVVHELLFSFILQILDKLKCKDLVIRLA